MKEKFEINISNYENFVVDYLDGNLSVDEVLCFEEFLLENPIIREEIKDLETVVLSPDTIDFDRKDFLKKTASTYWGN